MFRDDFLPYLKKLKDNKIFFDDPIEAAKHLNRYWTNIDYWWKNSKTQEIVLDFANRYIFKNKNRVQDKKYFNE